MEQTTKRVQLSEVEGHILVDNPAKPVIRAAGYQKINTVAGVSLLAPAKAEAPGIGLTANPYIMFDPDSKGVRGVWWKKYAFGFNGVGVPVLISCSFFYDLRGRLAYNLSQLVERYSKRMDGVGAAQAEQKGFVEPGKFVSRSALTEEEQGKGIFVPMHDDFGVWAYPANLRVTELLVDNANRQAYALQTSETLCNALLLRKHPASQIIWSELTGVEGEHVLTVEIGSWAHSCSASELVTLVEKAEVGTKELKVEGKEVQVTQMHLSDGEISALDIENVDDYTVD